MVVIVTDKEADMPIRDMIGLYGDYRGALARRMVWDANKFPLSAGMIVLGLLIAGNLHGAAAGVCGGLTAFLGVVALIAALNTPTLEESGALKRREMRSMKVDSSYL